MYTPIRLYELVNVDASFEDPPTDLCRVNMAALVMPLLVLNIGSEMILVLDQQLRVKKTPSARRKRELRAVMRALHDRAFITVLFQQTPTPTFQRLSSAFALRALSGQLANAPPSLSVNARAMDILYDAIRVGFKRQLLACGTTNNGLLGVTLNHLDATKRVIGADINDDDDDDDEVDRLVNETILRTHESYGTLHAGEWYLLRQYLYYFLQDLDIQRPWTCIHAEDKSLASSETHVSRPTATVYYYGEDGKVGDDETFVLDQLPTTTGDRYPYSTLSGRSIHEDRDADQSVASIVATASRCNSSSPTRDDQMKRSFKATASDALELLADLLASQSSSSAAKGSQEAAASTWKFTLFDDATNDEKDDDVPTFWIDTQSDCKEINAVRDEWTAVAEAKGDANEDEEEDLLRLLDMASS